MPSKVVLLGSGALARSVCYSLAVCDFPMTVTVAARSRTKASEVAYVGQTRAVLSNTPVRCRAVTSELSDPLELSRVLRATAPDLVLLAASYQSPWERVSARSAWTELLDRAGFGLTAPLHARLAATAAEVVAQESDARLLVAPFPDAVNPMLTALGLPVFAGVGNAALLTASLRSALDVDPRTRVRMLAHHVHLYSPSVPTEEARAWVDEVEIEDVTSALAAQRSADRRELNMVTGHTTALLIRDLLAAAEIHTNLPGPLGLPGGYPVHIAGGIGGIGGINLDLPGDIGPEAAVAWNRAASRRDGLDVDSGQVRFSDRVVETLEPHLPDLATGFPVNALGEVADRLLALRAALRACPDQPALATH